MNVAWLLTVDEVFEFDGPRTVLAGAIENGPELIPPGLCELMIGNRVVAEVEIEGEMMPSRRNYESLGKRAILIRGRLPIGRDEARRACLRPVQSNRPTQS